MANPFLAEIRIFSGNFPPFGWAFCDGQLLSISQHTALFSLLGTTYGGDGRSTFALPNLQGTVPMNAGQGPGLSPHVLGETGGTTQVTLLTSQMPAHQHPIGATGATATTGTPSTTVALAATSAAVYGSPTDLALMASQSVGSNQSHDNMQPYLALTFIIALNGIFPARN
jgi:microcystin-dependent protein